MACFQFGWCGTGSWTLSMSENLRSKGTSTQNNRRKHLLLGPQSKEKSARSDAIPHTPRLLTNLATVGGGRRPRSAALTIYRIFMPWHPACAPYALKECPMIDSNIEQYVREHEERVRRLDELYEKIRSPEYNEQEKNNFRQESLKLCLEGLTTVGAAFWICPPYFHNVFDRSIIITTSGQLRCGVHAKLNEEKITMQMEQTTQLRHVLEISWQSAVPASGL